ncbi:Uncharacterised protein [Bordetella pertussis]|nr:Uncharacterised protein [Bordetella pertussis]
MGAGVSALPAFSALSAFSMASSPRARRSVFLTPVWRTSAPLTM